MVILRATGCRSSYSNIVRICNSFRSISGFLKLFIMHRIPALIFLEFFSKQMLILLILKLNCFNNLLFVHYKICILCPSNAHKQNNSISILKKELQHPFLTYIFILKYYYCFFSYSFSEEAGLFFSFSFSLYLSFSLPLSISFILKRLPHKLLKYCYCFIC